MIANDPESLPLLYPLPQLHPPAVKLLLRFFYTGLVTTVDCSGDPLLAVECLRAADAFSQGAPQDRPRIEALKLHLEAQLTSALDSDLAGKAIARLNTTGMKDTLDRCMPLFMSHARRNGGSVLQGLLEGVDLDTFVAAVKGSEFPGGEIQKFRFIRAWAEGNNAGEQEKGVLDSLIDLEGIGLDDMEREVEVSLDRASVSEGGRKIGGSDFSFPFDPILSNLNSPSWLATHTLYRLSSLCSLSSPLESCPFNVSCGNTRSWPAVSARNRP